MFALTMLTMYVILAQFCLPHTFKTNLGKYKHYYPEGDMLLFSEFFHELIISRQTTAV
jgi:hypothetical protein